MHLLITWDVTLNYHTTAINSNFQWHAIIGYSLINKCSQICRCSIIVRSLDKRNRTTKAINSAVNNYVKFFPKLMIAINVPDTMRTISVIICSLSSFMFSKFHSFGINSMNSVDKIRSSASEYRSKVK